MALLNDHLSVWEIGLRWADQAPRIEWAPIPLTVRDNFRLMMDAIRRMHLACVTLSPEKWSPEAESPPEFFVRHHLKSIEDCIDGRRYSRKLLKFALIDRWDFFLWCRRQGIPLPEFWFPPSWKLTYAWPEEPQIYDINGVPVLDETKSVVVEPYFERTGNALAVQTFERVEGEAQGEGALRHNQRARMACQFVAEVLWKRSPDMTIAAVVKHEAIQMYCDAKRYDPETVREWVKVVAPDAVRQKRGRPRKETPPDDE